MIQNRTCQPVHNVEKLALRTAYANAMGVDSWIARKPLAGAGGHNYLPLTKPSVQAVHPGNSDKSLAAGDSGRNTSARKRLIEEVLKDSASSPQPESKETQPISGDQHARKESRPEAIVRKDKSEAVSLPAKFELSTSVIADVLVLDDMAGFTAVPSVYQKWLAALSLVLDPARKSGSVMASNRLRWPDAMGGIESAGNPSTALEAARELVQTWMFRQINPQIRRVIVMGGVPNQLLNEESWQQLTSQNSQMSGIQILRTQSSVKIWESAANKRQFWSQLCEPFVK